MVVELDKFVVKWLNKFSSKGGIPNISPRTIMDGKTVDFNLHFNLTFGAYFHTHEYNTVLNSIEPRTIGDILLGPEDSVQYGYNFLNLNTGYKIHTRSWKTLPMPVKVKNIMESLGKS